MQLRLDAADRLVELVEERRGAVPVEDAARALFALAHLPEGMARSLLDDVVAGDARLAWRGGCVALETTDAERVLLEDATFCVVDLETTGLSPAPLAHLRDRRGSGRAARARRNVPDARQPARAAAAPDRGAHRDRRARSASRPRCRASRRRGSWRSRGRPSSSRTTRASTSRSSTTRCCASRGGGLPGRSSTPSGSRGGCSPGAARASGSRRSRTSSAPPRGRATARCPTRRPPPRSCLQLIGLAQERGARSVGDLVELSAPRRRRVYGKRSLAFGAPTLPGVYLFRDAHDQVLYVGRARDLRARLRSYFRSERQRPSVEAALAAVESIEWRVLGSELEAALEELRLLRELRPPANARSTRPDRYVYLGTRGDRVVVTKTPTPHGPLKSRRRAELAARALEPAELDRPRERAAATAPQARGARRGAALRGRRAAARPRRRRRSGRGGARAAAAGCARPSSASSRRRGAAASGARSSSRAAASPRRARSPHGGGGSSSTPAWPRRAASSPRLAPEDADELLVVAQFLRRPPPELRVLSFDEIDRRAVA